MSSGDGYGTTPYDDTSRPRGNNRQSQTRPQTYTEDEGWGFTRIRYPPWVEAGNTGRFEIETHHKKDGYFNPTSLVCAFLDSTGASISSYVTIPTAISLGTGKSYYDVQIKNTLGAGQYNVEFTGTYTASDGNTIKIQVLRTFRVKVTRKKSQFVFKNTKEFGP